MTDHRRCESCGAAMPNRTHRQRNQKGQLVCDSCSDSLGPAWGSHSALTVPQQVEMQRRHAEALTSVLRVGRLQTTAHDSGDQALLHHCPFCGSGAVTGRSDGSAECDYCHTVFTVQVQPSHPNMPQTIDGQPHQIPGMPGGQETELSTTDDPATTESEDGVATDPLGDQQAAPTPPQGVDKAVDKQPLGGEPKKKSQPPWLKDKKSFRTSGGQTLGAEDYMAHLALSLADDREAVLDSVRLANLQRQAIGPTEVVCPECGGSGRDEDETGDLCWYCNGDGVVVEGPYVDPEHSVTGGR